MDESDSRGVGTMPSLPSAWGKWFRGVVLVFDPALTTRTEWEVEYHPKGPWRPLREQGWDKLGWCDRRPPATTTSGT